VNPLGGDLANYHLVVPRGVLWTHGFEYNEFTHEAGIPYGWNFFGIPAFLLGGDRGYVFLSFWMFFLLLVLAFQSLRIWSGGLFGAVGVTAVGFMVCGLAREYLANNDIPSVFVEAIILILSIVRIPMPLISQALLFGVTAGLGVMIKLTLLPGILILFLVFWLRICKTNLFPAVIAGSIFMVLGGFWPLVTFMHTGSPLPLVSLSMRFQGVPLPQLMDSMAILNQNFGTWYSMNYSRFFTAGMEGYALLLMGLPLALLFRQVCRADRIIWVLVGFGLARWSLMFAMTQRMDIFWHDRYHLISYLALGIAGVRGWQLLVFPLIEKRANLFYPVLFGVVLLLIFWQFNGRFLMRSPDPAIPVGFTSYLAPSMFQRMLANLDTFTLPPGAGRWGGFYDWMAKYLPQDSLVATTVIDPYHIQRTTIQILPVSQEKIDLAQSPEVILKNFKKLGVTHLHLTQFSGLNGWMNPTIDKWLRSVRLIPRLPGVKLLMQTQYASGKGEQAVYHLVQNRNTEMEEKGGLNKDFNNPPEKFRIKGMNHYWILLHWKPDDFSSYAVSVWDAGLNRYQPLGISGRGQSMILTPFKLNSNVCFRIRKFQDDKLSSPGYATTPNSICPNQKQVKLFHE